MDTNDTALLSLVAAPQWVVWGWSGRSGWQAVGSADNRQDAELIRKDRGRLVLPMGQHPTERDRQEAAS